METGATRQSGPRQIHSDTDYRLQRHPVESEVPRGTGEVARGVAGRHIGGHFEHAASTGGYQCETERAEAENARIGTSSAQS